MRGTTIAINGQLYDARTGLPVTDVGPKSHTPKEVPISQSTPKVMSDVGARPAQPKQHHASQPQVQPSPKPLQPLSQPHPARATKAAHSMHSKTQRSKTLHRAALKRPAAQYQAEKPAVKRSAAIQKFAPANSQAQSTPQTHAASPQRTHTAHHTVAHAAPPAHTHKPKAQPLQGSALKEKLINDQLANSVPQKEQKSSTKFRRKYPRLATIASGITALVLLGGYLTYLNLPNLSLRVAASQAGVAATYPTYQPSGYSFSGPVAYSPGEVRVNFKSNTNDYAYSVIQRESNWDSQAVRDNYVTKENKQYTTIQEGGITIYLVNNKAVWVNGGVLYTVEGNAPLSGEQVQKIASSTL